MIITYSYLDQYKHIGAFELIDYYAQTTIVETPFPLSIVITESLEYGIKIAQSLEYGITLAHSNEYGIAT